MKKIIKVVITFCILMLIPFRPMQVHAEIKPEIVINSYELNDKIEYGEKNSIYVVFVNESTSVTAENVLVTYYSENKTVIPAIGTSNQFYITSIQPSAAVGVEIPVVFLESESGFGHIRFELEYTTTEEALLGNSSDIVFPLTASGSLAIKNINITSNTTVGANSLIGVGYNNEKAEDIHNVKLIIEGEITGKSQIVNVGDLYANQSKYTEVYVTYEEVGERNIKITMTYDDEKGNNHVVDGGSYTVKVKSSAEEIDVQEVQNYAQNTGNVDQTDLQVFETPQVQNTADITLVLLGIAGAIVLILIVLILIKGLKRK